MVYQVGNLVKIKKYETICQKFNFYPWIKEDVVFKIYKYIPKSDFVELIADGYGDSENPGNGIVFVNIKSIYLIKENKKTEYEIKLEKLKKEILLLIS